MKLQYRKQVDEERLEKERIHREAFIGIPILKELIKKMYSDYQEYIPTGLKIPGNTQQRMPNLALSADG